MKRLALIVAVVAVAGGVAATPAVAGLAGNPSFSHEIPVPAPSAAKAPLFADDHGGLTPHAEPGDDHGGITPHAEPGDDHGGATPAPERSDDGGGHHGGRR